MDLYVNKVTLLLAIMSLGALLIDVILFVTQMQASGFQCNVHVATIILYYYNSLLQRPLLADILTTLSHIT